MGLTSRSGIVPLDLDRDIGGPMARTVADAVTVFDVIAGPDPDDPITQASRGKMPTGGYTQFLRPNGLRGARLGVLRYVMGPTADPEVVRLFDRAIADLKRQGASVVDPVSLPELEKTPNVYTQGEDLVWTRCSPFKYQLHDYLANVGPNAPVHDVDEVIKSGKFHPSIEWLLRAAQLSPKPPHDDSACEPVRTETRELRRLLARTLDGGRLDALVYPSWSNPPRLIGDLNTPGGENSGRFSPPTGFPAITVPMGYARDFLPIGLEFVGASWSEATLFRLAYSYEHATNHRRAPAIVPALATGSKVLAK
jgi:Asp-tRNA(Asn)/Glu-tRNA(Gln) amidotransferase A subunit family amidase